MSSIGETLRVACPYVRAREYLHAALWRTANSRPGQPLLLTAPLPAGQAELDKRVRWYVGWEPEADGVYPSFSGVLTVRADEDGEFAILELTGSYAPPLGTGGALFDKALGKTIAVSTVQALLTRIAADLATRYRSATEPRS